MATMPLLTIRVSEDLIDAMDTEARRRGANRSELIRATLEEQFGFGARPAEDRNEASPPQLDDALALLKQAKPSERRRRHTGQMTTATGGPAISGREEARRQALRRIAR